MLARERRFALTLSIAHGMDHFLLRSLPPLIPLLGVIFGYPLWKLGLLVGARTFGSALAQAPMGVVSDRYDRRYLLPTGIGLNGIATLTFAVTPFIGSLDTTVMIGGTPATLEFIVMFLSMVVGGFGSSVLHPAGYPLLSENVAPARKGRALGMWGSAAKFGDGLAPAMIGTLLVAIAWNEILIVFGLAVFAYSVVLFVTLGKYETRPAGKRAAEAGTTETGEEEFNVWRADRRVYVYPIFLVFLFFAVRMIAAGGVNVFIPEFITSVYGYSLSVAGFEISAESTASYYYSALLITAGLVQIVTGRLVDRYDHRKVIIAFLGLATVSIATLAVMELPPVLLFTVLLVVGASLWGFAPARDSLISDITPASHEGRTFGYLWTGALLVSSISPVFIGYIGEVAGLRAAFKILAVVTFLSAVPIFLLLTDRFYINVDRYRETMSGD